MIFGVNVVLNKTVVVDSDDILTTCVVVIFRVKVTGIMSVDGIKLWLLNWLINYYVVMLLVLCQLNRDVIVYEDTKCHWCNDFDLSIATIQQLFTVSQIVGCPVVLS